jgi:uncharacterized membrane protein
MFNLEHAIAKWRQTLQAGGIKSARLLDELESHLREDVEQQVTAGANLEEAFDLALGRIGTACDIKTEFAKLEQQPRSKVMRVLCLVFAGAMLGINSWTLMELDLNLAQRLSGLCIVVVAALYVATVPFLPQLLSRTAYSRLMVAIKSASLFVAPLPIWALLCALHVLPDLGLMANMSIWLLFAAVAITVCACGFGTSDPSDSGGPLPPWQPQPQWIPPTRPCPPDFGIALPHSADFDSLAQQSLMIAREEAARLGHDFIGTEHVLLGVLKVAQGELVGLFEGSNIHPDALRQEIERFVPRQPVQSTAGAAPLTPRARKALQLAGAQAKKHNHPNVGAEHIFLGLLIEGSGVAAKVLKKFGIRLKSAKAQLLRG